MPLTDAGKDAALMRVFCEETCYLELRSGAKALGPGQRKLVTFTQPMGTDRHIENTTELAFLVLKAQTVDGWQIVTADGTELANGELEEALDMRVNEEVVLRAGDIAVRMG